MKPCTTRQAAPPGRQLTPLVRSTLARFRCPPQSLQVQAVFLYRRSHYAAAVASLQAPELRSVATLQA